MLPSRNVQLPAFNEITGAIRALTIDAIQQANSGHPGAPLGMAEIAEVLWRHHLKHNPGNPDWVDRDRFVLSNGHGSMLLYALLHLSGYDLPIEELKHFRQLHSKTPGHPEYGYTPGVETTTGPLGQGIANAVGMALAEKVLAAEFNRPGHQIVDHRTWVFLGDGCLMEGISHEVCSLAGTWGLGKLIAFYDDNAISIDGNVTGWFTDDTPARFEAYGWRVIRGVQGHDPVAIDEAVQEALKSPDRPTLICCKTVIGAGSPNKQNSNDVHGSPLGAAEVAAVREHIGWPYPPFEIPAAVYAAWDAREQGKASEGEWNQRFAEYEKVFPELAAEFRRRVIDRKLPTDWAAHADRVLAQVIEKRESIATRKASQNTLEALAPALPELIGGSADLASSNLTLWSGSKGVSRAGGGNYVYYGVREFGMVAIGNGMSLHGGLIPYSATFLMFSDYARNALRMAALMKIRQIFVFTHDSIGLGEDGPTHQPIEQAATLRMIPNMDVWRPCDTVETTQAWASGVERSSGPTSLLLSRQNLPFQQRNAEQVAAIRRGGYVLSEAEGVAQAVIVATGSEVALAMAAQKMLAEKGVAVRVVSMPATTVFDRQDESYRLSILPKGLPRVAVEAGSMDFWRKYVGAVDDVRGRVIGLDSFGESAPAGELFKYFGITVEAVVEAVMSVLK